MSSSVLLVCKINICCLLNITGFSGAETPFFRQIELNSFTVSLCNSVDQSNIYMFSRALRIRHGEGPEWTENKLKVALTHSLTLQKSDTRFECIQNLFLIDIIYKKFFKKSWESPLALTSKFPNLIVAAFVQKLKSGLAHHLFIIVEQKLISISNSLLSAFKVLTLSSSK